MNYTPELLLRFGTLLDEASHVVVMQAEHIDADSLGSSLGLEAALTKLGKQVTLYCHDEVPSYLKHFPGQDRVTQNLPGKYDLAILVDSSTHSQIERTWSEHKAALSRRPFVCIDHHVSTNNQINGANVLLLLDDTAGASGQQVVELAQHYGWELDAEAAYVLAAAIKSDTVNLSTRYTSAATFRAMAYLVEQGVDLEELRLNVEKVSSIPATQLHLRAEVLARTSFFKDNQIAVTYFTAEEYKLLSEDKLLIERTKHELRTLQEVEIAVVITERKGYSNASMRANVGVARLTAEHFGGGGHDKAASCRFENATHTEVTEAIVPVIERLLDEAL
ncbi:MAG: DHH family phosphoesterase [Candidatus Saccharimonadales bacterium]